MEHPRAVKRGESTRLIPLLDPLRYISEAEQALARGDHEQARTLIARAYFAFDLCAAGCEQARAWDTGLPERNS